MRDEVRAAVTQRFEACLSPPFMRHDVKGYTRVPLDNLLPGVDPCVLADFSSGDGGELKGDLPKFCAAHSSAALAANSFGIFRFRPERLQLAGLGGFTEARFEWRLPTGLRGTPPNLDFFAAGPSGVVAVESKFTETLGSKTAKFAKPYDKVVARLAEPGWQALFGDLRGNPKRFTRLDAAQLVKHYLGMRYSLRERPGNHVLLYVYWEPLNAGDLFDFVVHRDELSAFSEAVDGSAVQFLGVSYPTLWDEWSTADFWQEKERHIDALRARYLMPVCPAS